MTVCISAAAEKDDVIISCVDTMVSDVQSTTELLVGPKFSGLRDWIVLASGTLCHSEALTDTLYALLEEAKDNEPPTMRTLLATAIEVELPRFLSAAYLTPYGIDMPTFLNRKKIANFTEERWNEIHRAMADYSQQYDVELTVTGWGKTQTDQAGEGQSRVTIYSASRYGVTMHSDEGYYTSGSGAPAARSILSFFNYERHFTLPRALYCVAAAKFMAERSAGVGKNTLLHVWPRSSSRGYFIQLDELARIREIWESSGKPQIPTKAEDICLDILAKHQTAVHVSFDQMSKKVQGG